MPTNETDLRKNAERYTDPTACNAITNVLEEDRFHKLLHTIFYICELAGFHVEGRIVLTDKRTGKVWK